MLPIFASFGVVTFIMTPYLLLPLGLDMDAFYDSFGVTVESVYSKPLSDNMEKGLLIQNGRKLALTALGRDVSNYVSAEFLLDD